MTTGDGLPGDADRRIILFRPRSGATWFRKPMPTGGQEAPSPVADLSEFERSRVQDDYRHRMIVNAAALAFTVALVGAGVWIAESMAHMRKHQDCVLMGRKSCSPVPAPANDRWSTNVTGAVTNAITGERR